MEKPPVPEQKLGPSQIKQELYEGAGKRSKEQVLKLIDFVGSVIDAQREAGKGKLSGSIGEIEHGAHGQDFFVDNKVAYLPRQGNAVFVGDLHGDMEALVSILEQTKFIENMEEGKKDHRIVFLGDYADRGAKDVETLEIILALKARYPDNVVLLSGNHEDADTNSRYGLNESLQEKFRDSEVYSRYNQFFKKLPLACVSANGIVALHGGIPGQGITSLHDFNSPDRQYGIHWSDPSEGVEDIASNQGRGGDPRTGICSFGERAFEKVMSQVGGQVMVRGHEYFPDGIDIKFEGRLATIFSNGGERSSSSGYKGQVAHPKFLWLMLDKAYGQLEKGMGAEIDYRKPKYEDQTGGETIGPDITAELKPGDQFAVGFKGEPISIVMGGKKLTIIDSSRIGNTPLLITDPDKFDPAHFDSSSSGYKGLRVGEKVIIGRSNPGRFEFPTTVSREHCEITFDGNNIIVRDLNSKNGTKVIFKK